MSQIPWQERVFVSVKEAAQVLSITTWSVYQLCDKQAVESQYHGKRRLVSVESLKAYAASLPTDREAS